MNGEGLFVYRRCLVLSLGDLLLNDGFLVILVSESWVR